MNKIKKCFSVLTTAALMTSMATMLPASAEDTGAYGLTLVEVNDMESFKAAITADRDYCIKLTKDISVSQSTKNTSTDAYFKVGKGHKVIDLNGKDIQVSDNRTGKNFMHLTMFEVGKGAKLEVNDEENKGEIFFNGYILANSNYEMYSVDINRDIFHVDGGDLTINGGTILGGRSKDEYVYRPDLYYSDGRFEGEARLSDSTYYPRKNINATAIDMTSGSVTINGGQFYGRGIDHSWHTAEQDEGYTYTSDRFNYVRNGVIETDGGTLTVNFGLFYAKSNADVFQISDSTDVTIRSCGAWLHKNNNILIMCDDIMEGSYGSYGIPESSYDISKVTVAGADGDEPEKAIIPKPDISANEINVSVPAERMVYINDKKGFDTTVSYDPYFPEMKYDDTYVTGETSYSVTVYDSNSKKIAQPCVVGKGKSVKFNTFSALLEPMYTKLLPGGDYIMQIDVLETWDSTQEFTKIGSKTFEFSVTDKSPVEITQQPASALVDMQGKNVTFTATAKNAEKVKWFKSNPHSSPELVKSDSVGSDGKASLTVPANGEEYYAQFTNNDKVWLTTQKARAGFKPTFKLGETAFTPYQHDTLKIDFLSDYDTSRYADLIESDDIYVSSDGGDFEKLDYDNNYVYGFNQLNIINVNFTDARKYYRQIVLKDGTTYTSPIMSVQPSAEAGGKYITDYYITGFEDLCIGDKMLTKDDVTAYSDKYTVSDVIWSSGVYDGVIVSGTPLCAVMLKAADGYLFKFDENKELKGHVGNRSNPAYSSVPGYTTDTLLVYVSYDNHTYLTEPKDITLFEEDRFIIPQYSDVDIQLETIHDCPKQHEEKHTISKMDIFEHAPLPNGLTMDEKGHITGVVDAAELGELENTIVAFTYSDGSVSYRDLYFTAVEHEHEYVTSVDDKGNTHINCKHADLCGCKEIVIEGSVVSHHFGDWKDVGDGTHSRTCKDDGCGTIEVQPHTWDEGVTTKEATKDADGVYTYTCTVCGAKRTEAVKYEGSDDSSKPDSKPDNKTKYLLGDVTCDGTIDIDDAVTIISHINGVNAMTDQQMKIGNVDGEDASIDIADAVAIISHINGVKAINGYVEV